ncbi:MAG TPA: glycosyltransferase family 2 protein [Clostridia bacterium]|nr:glycosyltransferase family 2 protein [Clostridia bacterium]
MLIVTHNSHEYVDRCLCSVLRECRSYNSRIIVVDNDSSDDTRHIIEKRHPEVTLIASKQNLGFARANNLGLAKAPASKWILLLNPDTEMLEGSLATLMNEGKKRTNAGVLGPMLLNEDGTIQKSCRNYPTILGEALRIVFLDRLPPLSRYGLRHWHHKAFQKVDWLSGACMLIPRKVADETGLFDPTFFMYSEDMDFCYRVMKMGLDVLYVPSAKVVHIGGGSSRHYQLRMLCELFKSKYHFMNKYYGARIMRFYRLLTVSGLVTRMTIWAVFGFFNQKARQKASECWNVILWHMRGGQI